MARSSKFSRFSFHFLTGLCNIIVLIHYNSTIVSSAVVRWRNQQRQRHNNGFDKGPIIQGNQSSSCNMFMGSWVRGEGYQLYEYSSCPVIDPRFNCQKYGRPDTDYLKYLWQPSNCQIPRFSGTDFLMRMRGKSVMFVGDSLGRNQWESLICMISAGLPTSASPTQYSGGDPLSTFTFLEYELSVSFYKAPYLVDIDVAEGKGVLKLGEISGNAKAWIGVDILCFNTGHWWTHKGSLQGWNYMESDGRTYQDMDRLVAMEKALRTWATWVDNIGVSKGRVFFQGISATHDNPSEWNDGVVTTPKSCYGETVPMTRVSSYPTMYSDQMKVLHNVLGSMNEPPFLLDITLLSAMRIDAHPSIYNSDRLADCSHWCLPGLPDTWNQLLYTALIS